MSGWDNLKVQLDALNATTENNQRYAEKYHKLVRDAYIVGVQENPGEKPTPLLVEMIVASKLSRFPMMKIAAIEVLREVVERDLALLMPTMFKAPEKSSHVIIDVPDNRPSNWRPFRSALSQVNVKKKIDRAAALLYVFSAKVEGVEYVKVGFTTEPGTYSSKNRYAPMVDYKGEFQIKNWGRLHEVMLAAFLGASFKESEWYTGQRDKLAHFLEAIKANSTFVSAPQTDMVNVSDFPLAFAQKADATLDDHLSLYRVRYRGAVYKLDADNINDSIGFIVDPEKKKRLLAAKRAPVVDGQGGAEHS
jgi:hypothetical protein